MNIRPVGCILVSWFSSDKEPAAYASREVISYWCCCKIFGVVDQNHNCKEWLYLYAQLWYVREIVLTKLFLVYVVVDVNCFMPNIASEFLHEIPWHAYPDKMRCEPMPTAVWCEVILKAF